MLRAAGSAGKTWGDFAAQPYNAASEHLIFVARK